MYVERNRYQKYRQSIQQWWKGRELTDFPILSKLSVFELLISGTSAGPISIFSVPFMPDFTIRVRSIPMLQQVTKVEDITNMKDKNSENTASSTFRDFLRSPLCFRDLLDSSFSSLSELPSSTELWWRLRCFLSLSFSLFLSFPLWLSTKSVFSMSRSSLSFLDRSFAFSFSRSLSFSCSFSFSFSRSLSFSFLSRSFLFSFSSRSFSFLAYKSSKSENISQLSHGLSALHMLIPMYCPQERT